METAAGSPSPAVHSPRSALVLSAGGLFGAYQAGAWKALAGRFRPDVVIGASAGALNAWAIAGGADPDDLIRQWLDPDCRTLAGFRWRQAPWRGVFDAGPLHNHIRRLWERFRPQIDVAVVVTEIPALKPRLFLNDAIGWEHLAASCAVLLCYEQIRIGRKLYSDGGLLGVLPLWAAAELGVTRVVAINSLPLLPSRAVRAFMRGFRALARWRPSANGVETAIISPAAPLGRMRDAFFWRREQVERWVVQGEADASRISLKWS